MASPESFSHPQPFSALQGLWKTALQIQEFIDKEGLENLTAHELTKLQTTLQSILERLNQEASFSDDQEIQKVRSTTLLLITKIEMELAYRR